METHAFEVSDNLEIRVRVIDSSPYLMEGETIKDITSGRVVWTKQCCLQFNNKGLTNHKQCDIIENIINQQNCWKILNGN